MKEESMATRSTAAKSPKQRLSGLYGGLAPSAAVARRATAAKQKALSAAFAKEQALRLKHARVMDRLQAPMLKSLGKDAEAQRAVSAIRSLVRQARGRKLERPVVPVHKPRIVADLGATVVPPYDFQEVLFSSTAAPTSGSSADPSAGQIASAISTDFDQPSSATVTAGVGIFFHPPTDCPGTLSTSATLSFTFRWSTICAFASAHSDGWVGLAVERFDLAGFPAGMLVDQKLFQWWADASWADTRIFSGSNNAFPLMASCTVDSQHFYHIWVRCGGSVSGAGFTNRIGGSDASSEIIASVPSITWELT
jgi:hypothetical protein